MDRRRWGVRPSPILRAAGLLFAAIGLSACSLALPAGPASDDADPTFGATALRLLELVNEARAEPRACGARGGFDAAHPLVLEPRLVRAAQRHSDDMVLNGYFSHTGSDGSSPAERVVREGYAWAAVGETIAAGHSTPEWAVSAWLASDGHCAIIMGARFAELGAGEANLRWTLVFARPR